MLVQMLHFTLEIKIFFLYLYYVIIVLLGQLSLMPFYVLQCSHFYYNSHFEQKPLFYRTVVFISSEALCTQSEPASRTITEGTVYRAQQENDLLLPSGFKTSPTKIYKLRDHLNGNKWS